MRELFFTIVSLFLGIPCSECTALHQQAATLPTLLPPALAAVEDLASLSPPDSLLLSCISSLVGLLSLPYTGTCQAQLCFCLLSLLHLAQPSRQRAASILLPLLPLSEVGEEVLCCLVPVVEAIGSGHLCPWPPSLLPTLHTAIHNSRSPAPQLQPWVYWGTYTGPRSTPGSTDAVLALGPHFSHYADWGPGGPDGPGHLALGL